MSLMSNHLGQLHGNFLKLVSSLQKKKKKGRHHFFSVSGKFAGMVTWWYHLKITELSISSTNRNHTVNACPAANSMILNLKASGNLCKEWWWKV